MLFYHLMLFNHQHQTRILVFYFIFNIFSFHCFIGRILLDGFFSSDEDILVPVKRSPSDKYLSLIPSTEAFLINSKHIELFLPIPLVPFELGQNHFFQVLKQRQWIEEMNDDLILIKIHQLIFSFDEFIGLLRWLCAYEIKNKHYIQQVFSKIHFRQLSQSTIIKLENVKYYDNLNLLSLPLPSNVLPSNIIDYISREDLQKRLSLSPITVKNLIGFYLNENQKDLIHNESTSRIILNLISQHWKQFNDIELNYIKTFLSNNKSIPTNQGNKYPNESYIPSINLSSDLSIINLYIPQIENDNQYVNYPVSIEFLKLIGCRTIHLPTLTNHSNIQLNNSSQTVEHFIRNLLDKRQYMSDNDLNALKTTQCIAG